jgi:Amt family ammonium transporter
VQRGESLSFSKKISRLATRLGEPKWQRYGATMLFGRFAGVGLTLLVMAAIGGLFFAKVYAADSTVKAADVVNPVNTAWTLIAAFLVFGMQVGFTMLEAGFCRSRETVNVLMECIVDTCLCGILFLRHWIRLYVQPWQRLYRLSLVLSAKRSGNI